LWGDVYLTRYDLISECLANRRFSHAPPGGHDTVVSSVLHDWLIYREGSSHAAIRQALRQPFVGNGMSIFHAAVAGSVQQLVVKPDLAGDVKVVAAFARAVPERIICDLL